MSTHAHTVKVAAVEEDRKPLMYTVNRNGARSISAMVY